MRRCVSPFVVCALDSNLCEAMIKGARILIVLLFTAATTSLGYRKHLKIDGVHAEISSIGANGSDCDASSCNSFDGHSLCSCHQFLPEAVGTLEIRAQTLLYNVLQAMRYLTDYEPTATTLQKLWIPTRIGNAKMFSASIGDLQFLQGAFEALPLLGDLATADIDTIPSSDFHVPAGAFPIMVEIWDEGTLSNEFVGEVGAPIVEGRHEYSLSLHANPSRSSKTATMASNGQTLGSVQFITEVTRTAAPGGCTNEFGSCTQLSLKVICLSAKNLANVDTFSLTDPYCKVRVKQDIDHASTKDKTPAIGNDLNPTFTKDNVFSHEFEVPVWSEVAAGETSVSAGGSLWTFEKLSIIEQFHANLNFLIKTSVLDGKECDQIEDKTAKQEKVCSLLDELHTEGGATKVAQTLARDSDDENIQACMQHVETAMNDSEIPADMDGSVSSDLTTSSLADLGDAAGSHWRHRGYHWRHRGYRPRPHRPVIYHGGRRGHVHVYHGGGLYGSRRAHGIFTGAVFIVIFILLIFV